MIRENIVTQLYCGTVFPMKCPQVFAPVGLSFLRVLLLSVVHVFVCQYVLQHEHGVLLTVAVGVSQLGEHGSDLRGVMRNVHLRLIGFQDRVLRAPRLRPVGFALVLFRCLTDDLFDAGLAVLFLLFIGIVALHALTPRSYSVAQARG